MDTKHYNNLNKWGFSLAEVLIVVAIMVILAAVSIPIFTSQVKTSRRNTDIDNYNAACHSAIAAYYSVPANNRGEQRTYCFDASTGMVHDCSEEGFIVPEGYGVSSSKDWDGIVFNMGPNFPCNESDNRGFVVVQFNNGDMIAWWETSFNIPSDSITPSTSGSPIVQLELIEEE